MAAAWQATGTLAASTGADITPTNPAHLAGDILLLVAWGRSASATLATPAGWTFAASASSTGVGYLFWKRATDAATANPLCDWNSLTGDKYAVVHCMRGCTKVGAPLSSYFYRGLAATTTDPLVSGIQTITQYDNSLIVFIGAVLDNAATGFTITGDVAPTSLTQHSYTTSAIGTDAGQGIATGTKATVGTIIISTDYTGGVPGEWFGFAFAMHPDLGGPTVGPARWIESGAIASSTGADITPVIPAHQVNDYLILVAASRSISALTTPAGWTSVMQTSGNPVNFGTGNWSFFYRLAMSSAETNPLCDFANATGDKYAFVSVLRGCSGLEIASTSFENWEKVGTDTPAAYDIPTLSVDALLYEVGISLDNTATAVSISTDTTPAALTAHSYETTATGSDAGCWASSGLMTGAARTVVLNHSFTGSPFDHGFGYMTFSSFPCDVILNQAPYQAHRLR